jgi:hypothetical protein
MRQSVNIAINSLLALYSTKGVQPGELTDNIFDEEYQNFSIKKNVDTTITLTLNYIEQGEELAQNVYCRYTYDRNKMLLLIEQKLGASKYSIQWCRNAALTAAVDNVVLALAGSGYSPVRIAASLATLPLDLMPRVRTALKSVA